MIVSLESENLQARLQQLEKSFQTEREHFRKEIFSYRKIVEKWKIKCTELNKKINSERVKIKTLEDCLAVLPTTGEIAALKNSLSQEESEKVLMQLKMKEMDQNLKTYRNDLISQELYISSLEQRNSEFKMQLRLLEDKISNFERNSKEFPLKDYIVVNDEDLKIELNNLKHLFTLRENQQQQSKKHHERLIQEYENCLSREEANVTAIKLELNVKDERIYSLRETLREISNEKQSLLEEKYALEEKMHSIFLNVEENEQLFNIRQQLMQNLLVCIGELKRVVQLFCLHANGDDPSLSLLLEVQASPILNKQQCHDSVQMQIDDVQKIRKDLKYIHSILSEKYAEKVGDDLSCANQ